MKFLLIHFLLASTAFAYFVPKGVPRPLWGTLDPVNKATPALPSSWPATNTYYVDDSHPSATDSSNTYGSPTTPRLTVPLTPAAGSRVFVASLTDSMVAVSGWNGTESSPIWIIGTGDATVFPDNAQIALAINGCDYLIVDGLNVNGELAVAEAGNSQNNKGFRVTNGSDYVCIRNLEIKNTVAEGEGFSGDINSVEADTANTSNVVLYNLDIHDCHGGTAVNYETGGHAIHIVGDPDDVYSVNGVHVLDCDIYNIAEDGIQVGETNTNRTKSKCTNIWIADNRIYQCGENAIDGKACTNLFIIENDLWGMFSTYGSDGAIVVINDEGGGFNNDLAGPENAWVVRNRIHAGATGVRAASGAGDTYVIGNLIYNLSVFSGQTAPTNGTHAASIAIHKRGGSSIHVVNNTAYKVGGLITGMNGQDVNVHGNILYDVNNHTTETFSRFQGIDGTITLAENFVFDPDGASSGDNGTTLIEADPRLLAPAAGLFGLTTKLDGTDSPCIGGTEHAVYATYEALTGQSIEYDFDERIRDGWDQGAFEYVQPLKDKLDIAAGDTLVFSGDSITDGRKYSHYLITWFQGMYPALNLKTYPMARSGSSIGGWLGFSPGSSSSGLYARYDYLLNPDVVFMMHGQNGAEEPPLSKAEVYARDYQLLWDEWNSVDGSQAQSFEKLVILTMHPEQETPASKEIEAKQAADAALAASEANIFHSPTYTWMGPEWLANSGQDIDIRQTTATYSPGTDKTHPGPAGHVVILHATLMGLEAEKDVSAVAIDAGAGTTLSSYQAMVSSLSATPTSVSFNRLDAALPMAIDEVGRANAEQLYRKARDWQRYMLRVINLAAGAYSVKIGATEIGQWSNVELANGINLSGMTSGPVWAHIQETLGEVRDLQAASRSTGGTISSPSAAMYRYESFTLQHYQNGSPASLAAYGTLMGNSNAVTQMDDEIAALIADAEPVAMTWTVTALDEPPPASGGATATSVTAGSVTISN